MDDDSRSQAILIVTAVFLAISGISVALRCFVRTHVVRAFGWDDTLMVLAMVFNLAFAICGIAGSKLGIGRKLVHFLVYPDNFHKALLLWWLGQIFYVITCVIAKLSIIITLLRITVDRVHAWVLYAAMTLATTVGLIFLFFTIFQCHPVNYFWNKANPHTTGTCVNKGVLIGIAYLYSIGAAITDLTIGLLPVALIWNLRMNQRTKLAIVGILGIGCIASAAVIVRIPFVHHYQDREFLYNTYQISIWSNVEAGLGITAGCLTTLRPLIRFLRDGSSVSRSRNPNAGSFPLSSNVAPGFHRSSRSKSKHERDDVHQLWTGSENDEYHGITTTIMGSQLPKPTSSSEEDLNPSRQGWKIERTVQVSRRDS
ncbi:hypothetical protein N7492_001556 [Penicillium capsulatum]|uniref:Rhodopsin domain-containing protein n=1 Tax=Penicillium capsulatum TaxID=69766 RepID=A0A9W9LZZ4_9EURO|nr:hypothetical protein N7492_001556 [Penicillium capsulatum]KAJ6129392.1 hypothetical protein N7512_002172 [Penicillium capsulatum]